MVQHKVKIYIDETPIVFQTGEPIPEIQRVMYHDVETLDGKTHQEVRYTKTNWTVPFSNFGNDYYTLREYIKANPDTPILCGFPNDRDGFVEKYYLLSIQSEKNKGYLRGNYFRNALVVYFRAVNPDE